MIESVEFQGNYPWKIIKQLFCELAMALLLQRPGLIWCNAIRGIN
jgi:hypothetical protein